jgi:5'-3' exonuclease
MNKKRLFAVDGNWYLHRIFHTQYKTANMAGAIANRFIQLICKDALAVKATRLVVAFDGNSIFRFSIFPDYKSGRKKAKEASGKESPYVYLPTLLSLLAEYGIPVIQKSRYEADDILRSIVSQEKDEFEVWIGCRDKDAYQYVSDGVFLYDSSFKPQPRTLNAQKIKELTGYTPKQFLAYQLLYGDEIDSIPNLMKPAQIKKGLATYGSLKKWRSSDKQFASFWKKNEEALKLNAKLVRLVDGIELEIPAVKFIKDDMLPSAYIAYAAFCKPKSKGLF